MKKVIGFLILLSLVNFIFAQTQYFQTSQEKTSFGVYAAEFGGALGGTVCCGGTGCVLIALAISSMFDIETVNPPGDPSMSIPILTFNDNTSAATLVFAGLAVLTLLPVSSAAGVAQVGKRLNQEGNFNTSFGCAVLGSAVGLGLGYGISRINPEKISWLIIPTTILGNSIGAVIGYNLRRNSYDDFGYHDTRFGLPSIGLRAEKTDYGKTITAVDFRLINAKF